MPYYEFECMVCKTVFSEYREIEKRNEVSHCNKKAKRLLTVPAGIQIDSQMRDSKGSPIWFPKVGKYYDRALQKTFESKKEKAQYMKENRLIQDGSTDNKSTRKDPSAGTTRKSSPIYSTPK